MSEMLRGNAAAIGLFLHDMPPLPSEAVDAAKRCLVDWTGVAIAGASEPVARAAACYSQLSEASLPIISANDPEKAALVNGTAGHALDFDDTHIPTDSHLSAVIWPVVLALSPEDADGTDLLRAFAAGYEVAAKISGRRLGFSLQFRWFHPTGVIGHIAATAAAAVVLHLNPVEAAHAIALSLTQSSGLRGSMGGMGKPFQVGRAAQNGVANACLAQAGAKGSLELLEPDGGFDRAFVQDGSAQLASLDKGILATDWAVLRTSFKPYACLHGIHPSIDAACDLADKIETEDLAMIRVEVAPGVKKVAQYKNPKTPLQAKFSVEYCVALGLCGRTAGFSDFTEKALADTRIQQLLTRVEVIPINGRKMLDSAVEVVLKDGRKFSSETKLSRGHPGNPLTWAELDEKFFSLANPVLGNQTRLLLTALKSIDSAGQLHKACEILSR